MCKIQTTIYVNNDTTNPLAVDVTINAEKQPLNVWDYEISINRVELVVGDKEGIDITKQLTARATALIAAQVNEEEDQINDALNEAEEPEPQESLFDQMAGIVKAHAKAFYGIDLNNGREAV
jgi:hypothetical protein